MESEVESFTDIVVEHICHHNHLFNTINKVFVFLNYKDYLAFVEEQRTTYCTPKFPAVVMNTTVSYCEVEECSDKLAWGSLNFKVAELPARFICGYLFTNAQIPIIIGVEVGEKETFYRKCQLPNYHKALEEQEFSYHG